MRLLVIMALVALCALVGIPGATAARADAPSCSAGSCEGKNAEATGCSADELLIEDSSESSGGSTLQMYYSSACQTVWAIFTDTVEAYFGVAELVTVPNGGGLEQVDQQVLGSADTGSMQSNNYVTETGMTQWNQSVKACGLPQNEPAESEDPQPDGGTAVNILGWCTAWH
ncbi:MULTISPECIES: DUF2690 domain-containing protein [Streptacidiphilus]|uniref:DUF2690 domain-containing protein n=2 Tax=Streptacidiphilus TaxID=228398 RepID=A0ABV6UUI2_9ACTN|nr:DUF2690 domain-containing protein [Streptacidiphilus jeojiense]